MPTIANVFKSKIYAELIVELYKMSLNYLVSKFIEDKVASRVTLTYFVI